FWATATPNSTCFFASLRASAASGTAASARSTTMTERLARMPDRPLYPKRLTIATASRRPQQIGDPQFNAHQQAMYHASRGNLRENKPAGRLVVLICFV